MAGRRSRVSPLRTGGASTNPSAAGRSAAARPLAGPDEGTRAVPTLVDNVETLANIPAIVANGAEWFRSVGTADSPGTIVCTITGDTTSHGVLEVAMGTPLQDVIDAFGGARMGHQLVAALSGAANRLLPADRFATPLSYEGMEAAGSGLGAAGFLLLDDSTDLVAVVQGVSRFLAVESCGQCTPCKQDGLAIADRLEVIRSGAGSDDDVVAVADLVGTVADEARCFLRVPTRARRRQPSRTVSRTPGRTSAGR